MGHTAPNATRSAVSVPLTTSLLMDKLTVNELAAGARRVLIIIPSAAAGKPFEEFMAQDRHYPAAASKVYSQALVKASSEGPAVFATVREMLEDCHEELSLHAHYTEVCPAGPHCGG